MKPMKTKLKLSTLVLLMAGIVSTSACKKELTDENAISESPISEKKEVLMKIDQDIDFIAKQLASSLNEKEIRQFIKNEALKKFDGDFDILYKDAKSKIVNGKTFQNHLAGTGTTSLSTTKSMSSTPEQSKKLESIGNYVPLLNIAVPVNIEKWDTENFTPLVAVRPIGYNEKTTDKIKAYDTEGNIHWLNAKEQPDFPVIVIGLNERTIETANGNVVLKSSNSSFTKIAKNKATQPGTKAEYYEDPNDGGSSGGGGGPTSNTGKHHINGCYEYLTGINCTDIDQYEGWIAGAPELRLRIFYADFQNSTFDDAKEISILMEPNQRSDVNNTWWELGTSQQLWTWNYQNTGISQLYSWYEEDESISFSGDKLVEIAGSYKQLVALPGGIYTLVALALAKSITIKQSTEFIGRVEVNAGPDIYEYGVGTGLRFRSRTATCSEYNQNIFNNIQ